MAHFRALILLLLVVFTLAQITVDHNHQTISDASIPDNQYCSTFTFPSISKSAYMTISAEWEPSTAFPTESRLIIQASSNQNYDDTIAKNAASNQVGPKTE